MSLQYYGRYTALDPAIVVGGFTAGGAVFGVAAGWAVFRFFAWLEGPDKMTALERQEVRDEALHEAWLQFEKGVSNNER
jgi:hypothetical protein